MKNFLYKKSCFKNISAIVVLFVFTLGITPKKTLHNWFATHKDTTSKIPAGNTPQLTIAGFNCNCDDLVAEPHFITFNSLVVPGAPSVSSFIAPGISSFVSLSLFHNNLRGPPLKF